MPADAPIRRRSYARAGLLGNPSDGYGGRTLSVLLSNFHAEVTLTPLPAGGGVRVVPNEEHDPLSFSGGVEALADSVARRGYYGGVRLLLAATKRFVDACRAAGAVIKPELGDFALSYETNIPRQTGLSGSSALIVACQACLFARFGLDPDAVLRKPLRPELVLSAERELGITAGLQDRVIQTYGGLVYMDFGDGRVERDGHGEYVELDPSLLPSLWLVWTENPSDSGKVHSTFKQRYNAGDKRTRALMTEVASLPVAGREALEKGETAALADLMDRNFDLRVALFSEAALGAQNLEMIAACRRAGAAAKFTGSGGAAVALCREPAQEEALRRECEKAGFSVAQLAVQTL